MQAGFIMQHRREYKKPLVFWSTVAFILGLIIMVNAQLSIMQGWDSKLLSSVNSYGALIVLPLGELIVWIQNWSNERRHSQTNFSSMES